MSSPFTLSLPSNLNGIQEVGIAAGVDEFTDLSYALDVHMGAKSSAPAEPTSVELHVASLCELWKAADTPEKRVILWSDSATITGATKLTSDEVGNLFNNWPTTVEEARKTPELDGGDSDMVVKGYNSWKRQPLDERSDLYVDVDKTLCANKPPVSDPIASRLWQGLVAFIFANGWFIRSLAAAHGLIKYIEPNTRVASPRLPADVDAIGYHPPQESANILVAIKLTWWMVNHHVGQREGVVEGFAGKVASLQNLMSQTNLAQNREVRSVLWFAGKIVSTRLILSAVGIPGIVYADASNTGEEDGNDYAACETLQLNVSPDVLLRVQSSPAGTAKLTTYYAIASRAAGSFFSVCIPPLQSLGYDPVTKQRVGAVIDKLKEIEANPARFHMGSRFLTGQPRLPADVWNEEELSNLAAFIHATAETSTLAKAPVILKKHDIQGSFVYAAINSARANLGAALSDRFVMALMARMGGGSLKGGMAIQFGRITDDDVKEVEDEIEKEKKKEAGEGTTTVAVARTGPTTRGTKRKAT